jgi:hypothetical protein
VCPEVPEEASQGHEEGRYEEESKAKSEAVRGATKEEKMVVDQMNLFQNYEKNRRKIFSLLRLGFAHVNNTVLLILFKMFRKEGKTKEEKKLLIGQRFSHGLEVIKNHYTE